MPRSRAQRAAAQLATAEAFVRLFAGEDGPVVLAEIARFGGVAETSMVEPADPLMLAFNEGRRALALEILHGANLTADEIARLATRVKQESYGNVVDTD